MDLSQGILDIVYTRTIFMYIYRQYYRVSKVRENIEIHFFICFKLSCFFLLSDEIPTDKQIDERTNLC